MKDKKDTIVAGDAEIPGLSIRAATEKETTICAALAARADANDPTFLPRPLYLRAADVTVKSA